MGSTVGTECGGCKLYIKGTFLQLQQIAWSGTSLYSLMDVLGFCIPFNSISVILRQWKGVHERFCAMKLCLGLERISLPAEFEPTTPWSEVRSANQLVTPMLPFIIWNKLLDSKHVLWALPTKGLTYVPQVRTTIHSPTKNTRGAEDQTTNHCITAIPCFAILWATPWENLF